MMRLKICDGSSIENLTPGSQTGTTTSWNLPSCPYSQAILTKHGLCAHQDTLRTLCFLSYHPDPDNKYFVPFNEAKWQLRCGQANDILHDIRSKIGLYSFIWKKTSGTFGQAAKTRNAKTISKLTPLSRNMTVRPWMSSMVTKSLLCRRKQFLGFGATISVGGTQAYGKQKVRIDQICCIMSSFELMAILATRIEWFRSSARTTRWKEEKDILEDEMKRTQHFYLHFHLMWKERSESEKQVGSMVSRGKAAFSAR